MAEVLVIVAGPVGSGKSAVLGVIEAALMLRGLSVRYGDDKAAQVERALTGRDWMAELKRTSPLIVLIEQIDRPLGLRAQDVFDVMPVGPGFVSRLKVAIDNALSLTWWRGYTAGLMGRNADD